MDRLMPSYALDLEVKELQAAKYLFKPVPVRILMVTDGSGSFDSTASFGLGRMIAAMRADPWWWARFAITTAHRGACARFEDPAVPHHDGFSFDVLPAGLSLASFDQIWLFGVLGAGSAIGAAEVAAIKAFMDGGGGVLAMGDHAELGAGMCSEIPRVKEMRRWKAGGPAGTPPPQTGTARHDTCREGPTPGYQFDDQSDGVPQRIDVRLYPVWSAVPFLERRRPHPILCGREGVLDVLPDHMHEGEIVSPASVAGNPDWPGGAGPEVIAWATVIAHTNTDGFGPVDGKRFGVLGAYDGHPRGVGRVAVDATWHHWFNINLVGFAAGSAEQAAIHNYYWNCGLWLSRAATIRSLAVRAAYGLVYTPPFRELTGEAPLLLLGGVAKDAIGRRASQCTVTEFVRVLYPERLREAVGPPIPDPGPLRGPYLHEEFALGGVMRSLLERFSGLDPPQAAPDEAEVAKLVDQGIAAGWREMAAFERDSAARFEKIFRAAVGEGAGRPR
ncbi:MAG TPA: hypothetical protein VLS93_03380 [Anaeromyxobacteraceae bacterium]|nr:hypothetical protein [Anaeromyxobacteraceae bacterium]